MAAGQNSELCHTLTALQNGFLHIDILIINMFPLVLSGIGSITSEILVNALSDRYDTHTGQAFIKRKGTHVKETKLKRMRIEINDKPENQQH